MGRTYGGSTGVSRWWYMCYICMYVFMCVCLCSEARCLHDVSFFILFFFFWEKPFHWSGIYLLASLAIQQALWTLLTLPSQTWVMSARYCTLLSMQMLGAELVLLLAQLTLCWLSYLSALVDVYFIVAIILCALGREPRALQMPNQDSTTDLPSAQYTFPDLSCIRSCWKVPPFQKYLLPKSFSSASIYYYILLSGSEKPHRKSPCYTC